jgi:hypothetical protein
MSRALVNVRSDDESRRRAGKEMERVGRWTRRSAC